MRHSWLSGLLVVIVLVVLGGVGYAKVRREKGEVRSFSEQVLGVADSIENMFFKVAIPATFEDTVTFNKPIIAPDLITSLSAGEGIRITTDKIPRITNTGILELEAGTGISVDGNKITSTITQGYTSLVAGTNISIDGNKITNTYTAPTPDYTLSGWTDNGTSVTLTTTTDSVTIPTLLTLSGIDNQSGGINNAGSITGATGFTSTGTITLGSLSTGIVKSSSSGILSSSTVSLGGSDVSGTLLATSGGTGINSYVAGDLIYASATNTLAKLGIGGSGTVLTVSSGMPVWGSVTGLGGVCPNCIVNDPGSTQTITPTTATATGLVIKQASSGSVDIFKVTNFAGTTAYLTVDSSGNVLLGSGGQTTAGVLTVNPTDTDPIAISPVAKGIIAYTGTLTSNDLTAARTWTFPDSTGIVCTTSGNCAGTSSALGGSGTTNYLPKWSATYALTDSLLFDNGTNVGIGTTNPGSKLDVTGTANVSSNATIGGTLGVTGQTNLSTLIASGALTAQSTLGVTGNATIGGTLGVTGNSTFNGTLGVTGIATFNSSLKLLESAGATYYTTIQAGNQSGNLTLTLPITSGTNGQFLSTNGSGTLAWTSSSGSGDITAVGSMTTTDAFADATADDDWLGLGGSAGRIEFDDQTIDEVNILSANVGVGTQTPAAKLHVSGGNGGNASLMIDQTNTTGDIMTASASGSTVMSLANAGTLAINSSLTYSVSAPSGGSGVISETGGCYYKTSSTELNLGARVYAYKTTFNGSKVFSSTYQEITSTLNYNGPGSTYKNTLTWNAVSGASGYRLLHSYSAFDFDLNPIYEPHHNYDYYYDTTSTSYVDTCNTTDWLAGSTVTPSSPYTFRNTSATFTDNVGIGTTQFGTNAAAVLSIANSTAPTAAITNGVQLYAVDVTGSHELKVMDEAGNATTISPHNFSLINDGPSEALAWSYYSEREGMAINADMTRALRLLEELTGEKLVHLEDLASGLELNDKYELIASESASVSAELASGQVGILQKIDNLIESLKVSIRSVTGYFEEIFVKRSTSEELCVGTLDNRTCLNQDQVKSILENLSPVPTPSLTPSPTPTPVISPAPVASESATLPL